LPKSRRFSTLQDQGELDPGLDLEGFWVVDQYPGGGDIPRRRFAPFSPTKGPIADREVERKTGSSHHLDFTSALHDECRLNV
jgi:hypothetical protein